MKNLNVFLLILFAFTMSCVHKDDEPNPDENPGIRDTLGIADSSDNVAHSAYRKANGSMVIAERDPITGKMTLLTDRLVKELSDGTPVKYFALRATNASYAFIRIGQDVTGNSKSEAFKTVTSRGKVSLHVIDKLVWYVTCQGSCTFCTPNSEGTDCECPAYIEEEDGDIKIVDINGDEIDTDRIDSNGMAECNFGSAGGGLFPTEVIH